MRVTDIDWRSMLRGWSAEDILYLRAICDDVLSQKPRRITIIRKE